MCEVISPHKEGVWAGAVRGSGPAQEDCGAATSSCLKGSVRNQHSTEWKDAWGEQTPGQAKEASHVNCPRAAAGSGLSPRKRREGHGAMVWRFPRAAEVGSPSQLGWDWGSLAPWQGWGLGSGFM